MITEPAANKTVCQIWQTLERDRGLLASLKSDDDAVRTQKDAVWIEFIPTPGLSLWFYAHTTFWVAGLTLEKVSYDLRTEIGREIAKEQIPEDWSVTTPDRRGTNQKQRVAQISAAYDSNEAELSKNSINLIADWFESALRITRSNQVVWP